MKNKFLLIALFQMKSKLYITPNVYGHIEIFKKNSLSFKSGLSISQSYLQGTFFSQLEIPSKYNANFILGISAKKIYTQKKSITQKLSIIAGFGFKVYDINIDVLVQFLNGANIIININIHKHVSNSLEFGISLHIEDKKENKDSPEIIQPKNNKENVGIKKDEYKTHLSTPKQLYLTQNRKRISSQPATIRTSTQQTTKIHDPKLDLFKLPKENFTTPNQRTTLPKTFSGQRPLIYSSNKCKEKHFETEIFSSKAKQNSPANLLAFKTNNKGESKKTTLEMPCEHTNIDSKLKKESTKNKTEKKNLSTYQNPKTNKTNMALEIVEKQQEIKKTTPTTKLPLRDSPKEFAKSSEPIPETRIMNNYQEIKTAPPKRTPSRNPSHSFLKSLPPMVPQTRVVNINVIKEDDTNSPKLEEKQKIDLAKTTFSNRTPPQIPRTRTNNSSKTENNHKPESTKANPAKTEKQQHQIKTLLKRCF